MILFQFTGLTAGDVIEISQTKQQVSAPIQPPNTPPFLLALQRSPLVVCYLYNERGVLSRRRQAIYSSVS